MTAAGRRRLLRWLFYTVAGLLLACGLGLILYLRSDRPERFLREELRRRLEAQLGGSCDFEGLEVGYLPPSAIVTNVRCDHPSVTVARAEAMLSFRGLLRRRVVVEDLDLFEPSLIWDADSDRFPERPASAAPGVPTPRRFTLRRMRIQGGSVTIGSERRELSAELHDLLVSADNGAEPGSTSAFYAGPWDGSASFARGSVRFGDFALSGLRGSVGFGVDSGGAHTRRLRLRAESAEISGDGEIKAGDPPHMVLSLAALFSPQSPALRHPLPQITAAQMTADSVLEIDGRGARLTGTFTAVEPVLDPDRRGPGDKDNGPLPAWHAASAEGSYTYAEGTAQVQAHVAELAGGAADVKYRTDRGAGEAGASPAPRMHHIIIDADQMSLARTLAQLGELPGEQEITPSATVTGRIEMEWESGGFGKVRGLADLGLSAKPGELPVAGELQLAWRGRALTIRNGQIELPSGRLGGSGTIDFTTEPSRYDVSLEMEAEDIAPLMDFVEKRWGLASPASRPALAPGDLSGPARIDGEISGTGTTRRARGTFSSSGLVVSLPVAGGGPGARLPLRLDRAEGTFDFGPAGQRVEAPVIRYGGMAATLRAEAPPQAGPPRWTVSLDATQAPAELVARLLGQEALASQATGTVEAHSVISTGLNGTLSLSSSDLAIKGIPLQPARAAARLRDGTLLLDEVSCALFGGRLSADGSIDLNAKPAEGVIELRAQGLDLTAAGAAMGRLDLRGDMEARGRFGVGETPFLEGRFSQTGVSVSGMDLGTITGHWSGPPERLRIELENERSDLRAEGELRRQRGDPVTGDPDVTVTWVDATVEVSQLSLEDIAPLLPAAAPRGLDGDADGVVTVRGPLHAPDQIEVRAQIERLALTAGDVVLHNEAPISLTLMDQYLTVAATRLTGERTDLLMAGSISLTGSHDVTARLDGKFDLGLLQVIYPAMRASGPCTAALRFVEREDRMTYAGTLELAGARIAHPALPMPIEDLYGTGAFDDKGVLHLKQLRGTLGGGMILGSGEAAFEGASMPRAHLELRGLGVRAEILPQLRAFFDADVTLDKQGAIWRMGGLVQIQRAVYERAFGVSATDVLARSREFGPGGTRLLRERPATVLLDFDIIAENNVWIRNKDALIEASAHLTLEGTVETPLISGNISALEGGTFRFRDVTYVVRGGSMDFADPTQIDPLLDIKAATQVQHYEVLLSVTGKFSKPVFELSSEPALPQRDIVWLLLTGHTLSDNSSQAAQAAAEGQIAAYLAAPVAGAISGAALSPLEKLPGIYSVSIDPYFLNGTADPSARLTVTSRMTNALLFTYSTALGAAGQEVYQIEYNPGRLWDLIGTRDEDGSLTADVRIRRRWRPGPAPLPTGTSILPGEVTVGSLEIVADTIPSSEAKLRRLLHFESGDRYARGDLLEGREALRRHYIKSGYPAARVQLLDDPLTDDQSRRRVLYNINAGPRHELVFEGADGTRALRNAVEDAWLEPILFEDPVQEARAATTVELKQDGYYKAEVQAQGRSVSPELKEVRLDVAPGQKVQVRSIRIQGNAALPEERILRQMLTRPDSLFTRGLLREKVLAEDAAAIRSLYQASGYLDVVVPPPVIDLSPDGRLADIIVNIQEGSPSIISAVRFTDGEGGPTRFPELPEEELAKAARVMPGQVVSPVAISEGADRLRQALDARGYTRPLVTYTLSGPPDASEVIFNVTAGETLRVRRVRVDGNSRTRSAIVKKEVTLQDGDRLSRAALLDIQRRLYGLGVFSSVHIVPEPVASQPGFADVHITVQEGPHILTAWGVGYNTENLLGGSFELADNNLFGTRRSAGLFLRGSARDWRVQLSLRDPNLFGEKIETLLSGFVERQESDSFTTHRRAATFQLNRKFTEQLRLYGGYRLEDVELVDLQISASQTGLQTGRIGSIGGALSWDTRDDLINPRRGGVSTLSLSTAHPWLASEATFDKAYASVTRFVSLSRRVVWGSSLRAGFIFSADDSPASERFFAGGDTTLRGFGHNQVGPEDPNTGEPIGGDSIFLFNEEIRFGIWKSLQGVTFFDAGNVYRESNDFDLGDMRAAAGLGLRLNTPFGPFRVEYGWKLDRQPGESAGEFFFSIGQAF